MKNENTERVSCSRCQSGLYVRGIEPGQLLVCSACDFQFVPKQFGVGMKNGKATWSFMLGIASIIFMLLAGVPAIFLGVKALRQIRRGEANPTGRLFARIGVLLGATTTSFWVLMIFSVVAAVYLAFANIEVLDSETGGVAAEHQKYYIVPQLGDVEPSNYTDVGHLFRFARLRNNREESETYCRVVLGSVRKGFLGGTKAINNQFSKEATREYRHGTNSVFTLSNDYDSFDVKKWEMQTDEVAKQTYITIIPVGNKAEVLATIELETKNFDVEDQPDFDITEDQIKKFLKGIDIVY